MYIPGVADEDEGDGDENCEGDGQQKQQHRSHYEKKSKLVMNRNVGLHKYFTNSRT